MTMAARWHQGTIALRVLKKNKKKIGQNAQKQIFVFSDYRPRGHGSVREQLEMVTAPRMQNMVENVRKPFVS